MRARLRLPLLILLMLAVLSAWVPCPAAASPLNPVVIPFNSAVARQDGNTLYGITLTAGSNTSWPYDGVHLPVYKSTDNGVTWNQVGAITLPSPVPKDNCNNTRWAPGNMVFNYTNGRLVFVTNYGMPCGVAGYWTEQQPGAVVVFVSSDGGVTWSTQQTLYPYARGVVTSPVGNNTFVAIASYGDHTNTYHLDTWISQDGGLSWTENYTLSGGFAYGNVSNVAVVGGYYYFLTKVQSVNCCYTAIQAWSTAWAYGSSPWGQRNTSLPYSSFDPSAQLFFPFGTSSIAYFTKYGSSTSSSYSAVTDLNTWTTKNTTDTNGAAFTVNTNGIYTVDKTATYVYAPGWNYNSATGQFASMPVPSGGSKLMSMGVNPKPYLDYVEWDTWNGGNAYYARNDNDLAPVSPAFLSPSGGWTTATPTLSWQFSDPDPWDIQGGYEVQIYQGGTLKYDTGQVLTSASSLTIPGGVLSAGSYTWQVRTADNWMLWGPYSSPATFSVDTAPPVISSFVPNGSTYSRLATVSMHVSATDAQSGLAQLRSSVDGGTTWGNWAPFVSDFNVVLSGPDGPKTVVLQIADAVGNIAQASTTVTLDTITPTVSVAFPSSILNTPTTTAAISVIDSGSGPNQMHYRLDTGAWSAWGSIPSSLSLSLGADGTHTLQVEASDLAGNISSTSATVLLDTTPPAISITIGNGTGWANTHTPTLYLSATDSESGLSQYQVSMDSGNTWSSWAGFAPSVQLSVAADGTYSVVARVRDAAGNVASTAPTTLRVDTVAPTGTMNINGGRNSTTSTSVTVAIQASDASGGPYLVRLANDTSALPSAPWQQLSPSIAWSLAGNAGQQNWVYAQISDPAGNISVTLSASILLTADVTPPTVSLMLAGGASSTTSHTITAHIVAVDDTTPAAQLQYRLCNGGQTCGPWQASPDWSSWDLYYPQASGNSGVHLVVAQVQDLAGNIGTAMATINLNAAGTSSSGSDAITIPGGVQVNLPTGSAVAVQGPQVTLGFSSTTATAVRVSLGGVVAPTDWLSVGQPLTINLGLQQGTAAVAVQFRDAYGTITSTVWQTFLVLTQGPVITSAQWDSGATATKTGASTLHVVATEQALPSGLLTYSYRVDSGAWVTASGPDIPISSLAQGYHTVTVRVVDPVGNSSSSTVGIWSL